MPNGTLLTSKNNSDPDLNFYHTIMKPQRILVVDDERDVEPLFRQKFRKEIKDRILEFFFSFSGDEALGFIHTHEEDNAVLVLSDINMPGMSGLELLRQIKSEFPELKVVMITAYGDDQNSSLAKSLGADGFLTKPVDFELLRQELKAIAGE